MLVGIGVPSKYLTLPEESDSATAVTLNRARRLIPQTTKYTRISVSQPPRIPRVNPNTAGATPNETISARESRSAPSTDRRSDLRAQYPSKMSKNNAENRRANEIQNHRLRPSAM